MKRYCIIQILHGRNMSRALLPGVRQGKEMFMKFFGKKNAKKLQIVGLLAGVVLGLGSMLGTPQADAAVTFGGPFNKDANAVLFGGASNTSTIANDYKNGVSGTMSNGKKVTDSAASIHDIYSYFGISSSDIQSLGSTAVAGTVNINGNVYVGSHLVATNAMTAGRQDMSGSHKVTSGTTFYTRPPSVSFQNNSLTAYVVMQNGQFKFAILSSCGNPVKATPKKPAAGKLVCTALLLTPGKVESNGDQFYDFSAKANATNATITQYTFNYGGNVGSETIKTSAKSINAGSQLYAPGTYHVSVTVSGKANNVFTTAPQPATCTKSFTVAKPASQSGTLTCNSLTLTPVGTDSQTGDVTYTLTAETGTHNATISKYIFSPGNGTADQTFQTNSTKVTTQPIVYTAGKTFSSIYVTVYGTSTTNGKALTAGGPGSSCATNLTVPPQTCATGSQSSTCHPTCTAPNGQVYPAGSTQCLAVPPPVTPITPAAVTTPTQLANTGPGDIVGLFIGVSSLAGLGYHFFGRRFSRGL